MSCQTMANEVIEMLRGKAVNSDCPDYNSDCSDYIERVEPALRQMEWDKALNLCRQGLALCSEVSVDTEYCRAIARMYLGAVYHAIGDLEEAENWYRQSANISSITDRDDSQWNEALAVYALGLLQQSHGALEEAQKFYHRSLRLLPHLKKRAAPGMDNSAIHSGLLPRLLQRLKKRAAPGEEGEEEEERTNVDKLERQIQTRMEHLNSLRWQRETLQQRMDYIPIVGTTAAGDPILAIEVRPEDVFWDTIHLRDLDHKKKVLKAKKGTAVEIKTTDTHFALRVEGNSMTGVGIENGDYVIFRRQPIVEQNEIAVVRIDDLQGSSSTVKRFYRQGKTIYLKPENPKYQVQIFHAGDPTIEILGKAVAVVSALL